LIRLLSKISLAYPMWGVILSTLTWAFFLVISSIQSSSSNIILNSFLNKNWYTWICPKTTSICFQDRFVMKIIGEIVIVINCVHILIIFSDFFQKLLKKIFYYIDRNFLSSKFMCFITHLILVTMSSAIFLLLSGKYFFAYIAPTAFVREPKKKLVWWQI